MQETSEIARTLCGYAVVETLREECTLLAAEPGERRIVLKRLDADCLLQDQLHPSVRERLERVRELAHAGVANLHGVAAEGKEAWLIWDYAPGESFDAYASDPGRSIADVRGLARELALTVDSLHQQGIVHGALVPGNVLVSPGAGGGTIRLTHVSPLLFSDPAVDAASVVALLEHVLDLRGERNGPLGNILAEARTAELPLSMLASRLAAAPAALSDAQTIASRAAAPARRARRRALSAALLVTAAALAGGLILWRRLDPRPAPPPPIIPGTEISIRH
jgi:hypothetical protein